MTSTNGNGKPRPPASAEALRILDAIRHLSEADRGWLRARLNDHGMHRPMVGVPNENVVHSAKG